MELTSKNVENVFMDCLYKPSELKGLKEGEAPKDVVIADAIMMKCGFEPHRLSSYKKDIATMLSELPNEFQPAPEGGGGWAFQNMVNTKDGVQWTDFHQRMDQLLALGLATDQMQYLMPRDMWSALPGGLPYVAVKK